MGVAPINARRRLGEELRQLRRAAGLTGDEVGAALLWSPSKVSRIETAKSTITQHTVRQLCALYEAEDATTERLISLMEDTRDERWWLDYTDVISSKLEDYISAEASASHIQLVNASIIPGLLQTPEYSKTVMDGAGLSQDPETVATHVEIRQRRQKILSGEGAPLIGIALHEATMHADAGRPDMLRRQLEWILKVVEFPNVEIRAVTFSSPATLFMGAITLFDFADARDSTVAAVEQWDGMSFFDSPKDVRRYRRTIKHLMDSALPPEDTAQLIQARISQL